MSEPGTSAQADLAAHRAEIRAFIEANAPEALRGTSESGPFDGFWGGRKHETPAADVLRWRDVCVERGLTAPHWPKVYGGGGMNRDEAQIVWDEMRRLGLPRPVVGFGFAMIGPTLLQFGSEAQKQLHLPRICRGEIRWCQGYSEPGAGSDLAALQTRAVRDGDEYVVDGQKIWTSHADKSDWIFCLVRTDPTAKKQAGISFLLIDLASPGVAVRHIELISGASPFCEVFFDGVRVPVSQRVSEENHGWTVAKALLGHERAMIGSSIGRMPGSGQQELVARARRYLNAEAGPLPDPLARDEVARAGMDEAIYHLALRRIQQLAEVGAPGTESSILKIAATEMKQRRYELGMELAGLDGLVWERAADEDLAGFDPADRQLVRDWLRSRASTIEGGSSEIQLNIIAKRVLGLPDA